MINLYIALLAGGIGSRANTKIPKQWIKIHKKTLAEYSIKKFHFWIKKLKKNNKIQKGKIIFVSHPHYLKTSEKLYKSYKLNFVEGGSTRHDSTKNAFQFIKQDIEKNQLNLQETVIFIHDAARPIFLIEDLEKMFNSLLSDLTFDCFSLISSIPETILEFDEKINSIQLLNREKIFSVKTPQALRGQWLEKFLEIPTKENYTDLITWAKEQELKIKLINSFPFNIKVTYPFDIKIIEFLLKQKNIF